MGHLGQAIFINFGLQKRYIEIKGINFETKPRIVTMLSSILRIYGSSKKIMLPKDVEREHL